MSHLVGFGKRTGARPPPALPNKQEEPTAMIEGLMNGMTPDRHVQASGTENDGTIESVALAGAAAIQRLITDRDSFRSCASAQQRDLVALSSVNEDLRRRLAIIRHHYVDRAIRDAMRDQGTPMAPSDDANLVALAHRLKPGNGSLRPANEEKFRER